MTESELRNCVIEGQMDLFADTDEEPTEVLQPEPTGSEQ